MDGDIRKGNRHKYGFDQYVTLDTFNMYSTSVTEIQQHLIHTKFTGLVIFVPLNID
jgi:hypothetical protein